MDNNYALYRELPDTDYQTAIEKVTLALKDEGFGILTTIDVKATLKIKIDVDFRPYTILGACNPSYAHQALGGEPLLGVLLPCNVVVMERDGSGSIVAALKPSGVFSLVESPEVLPIAERVEAGLRRALGKL